YLQQNQLSNSIPDVFASLQNLVFANMSLNAFTGQIPPSLGSATSTLKTLDLSQNALSGTFPTSFTNLYQLETLYLDDNFVTGSIPNDIGRMISLTGLRLQNNSFSGNIPAGLGNDRKVVELRLDNNKLVGDVPDSLGNLTLLETFSVSGNCLEGNLPTSLLKKFNGLGVQGTNCAVNNGQNNSGSGSSSSSVPMGAVIGGAVGGVVLIAAVIGLFLFMRRRSTARENHQNRNNEFNTGARGFYPDPTKKNPDVEGQFGQTSAHSTTAYVPVMMQSAPPAVIQTTSPTTPPFRPQTHNNYATNLQVNQVQTPATYYNNDTKAPPGRGLFDMTAPRLAPRSSSQVPHTDSQVDVKIQNGFDFKEKMDMAMTMAVGMDGYSGSSNALEVADVEAMLQNHMGPYIKWSCDQVVMWAREKKFDESFVQSLKQHEVDGSMLHTLDRETLRSDLGVTDFKTRAKVLKSIEVLRDSNVHMHSNGKMGPIVPIRGASAQMDSGDLGAPPVYMG
ncbi:hypothetical protein HDU76_008749, partial [Blyttiomyces sp. JEL0837]